MYNMEQNNHTTALRGYAMTEVVPIFFLFVVLNAADR
jgi:hypothetical protein